MKTETKEYPLLTKATLALLERKVDMELANLEDLELIDHYMTTIKRNKIMEEFAKEAVYSLEEYLYLLKDSRGSAQLRAAGLTGHLLGCIHVLQRRVRRGEQIY